ARRSSRSTRAAAGSTGCRCSTCGGSGSWATTRTGSSSCGPGAIPPWIGDASTPSWRSLPSSAGGTGWRWSIFPRARRPNRGGPAEHFGMSAEAYAERRHDALLLNLANSVTAPLRAGFARSALFDLDPGTFQLWAREWDMGVGSHDAYLTIGMNLGAPDSPIP